MNNNNGNKLYMHRIIKLISPITCQTFKVELNGEEEEMRELLGTILEINPKSIKGLRDSFNNYYTISSAVKNPLLNTDPYNYYTVVVKGLGQSNDIKYIKYPSLNLSNRDQISNGRMNYEKNYENKTINFLEDENYYQKNDKYKTKDFMKFAKELYRRNYIDKNLKQKLKKLIKENNIEVISILKPYLNSKKSYDELAKKIKPVISSSSQNSENNVDSKHNSSYNSSHSKDRKKHKNKNNKDKENKNNENNENKKETKEEKILNDIKLNFEKKQYSKLKELLKKKNPEIIKSIKKFEKDNDYNHLLSKLNSLSKTFMDNSEEESGSENSNESNENSEEDSDTKKNDSSDFAKEVSKNKKKNKSDLKEDNKKIKNITKNILSALKKGRKDLYYVSKYDLDKMNNEEKMNLFKKKFKLKLDKINSGNNYKISKKNISTIENYYVQFMNKKVFKDLNEDEKSLYEQLFEEDKNEENNVIYQIYKDLLKHKDLNELQEQIKKIIEEAEKMELEEGEEEDEGNKKSSIKEENEEEEEEDYEGEEDEENEGDENDDEKNKKEESSSNNFILKNNDKDATAQVLNNNYKKNYQFSNFVNPNNKSKSKSKEKSVDKSETEDKKNNEEENNLGLNFVVIKPKKVNNKEEEKKDQDSIEENNSKNNINMIPNKEKELSVSTNTKKKMNAFISQIEHIKKIDDIKKPLIEAIHRNNIYIMELYEKFQKNKSILNKKSLYDVYKKIKENPEVEMNNQGESNKKFSTFKSLVQNINELDEKEKKFICYDFSKKSSKFLGAFEGYEKFKDKDDFNETVLLMMNNKNVKELYIQFCIKEMKEKGNNDIFENSKEIIKLIKKSGLYNEKDCEIMESYLGKDDGVFLGIFRELFKTDNFNEFMETMNIALENKKKEGNNKSKWDNELIKKNYEELKQNMEEKYYNGLEKLYRKKSDKLFDILQNLNSTNLNKKVESVTVLILKKELSPT